ncbi:probable G-protein coupled receptor Mth-like 14 isoform X1 [Bactrocera neohumeralis]|nr:probable G-protein coupled receptor Mth-like 14 isoform X2 [Bactrocera tryoni]XP_039966734.1 probable G-protein coupled receptor Mth-like 14 isoform X2 [Bactrocera tryoni]XP_039966735.1 probable G-protein coupled receptor Mth-like 14 isoform X2 [Bactrocera tryoni]XP_039966736.1 probable G-protein coupled receptor Mth-like 14 isoform X2 [Bactrocera tryoni]XP_050334567.1 probable G-protein coupled receptor Mth-like 14 isoform X1 [Bactrocera neohumeralis]XP_050334569.1 probable G-protein coupl
MHDLLIRTLVIIACIVESWSFNSILSQTVINGTNDTLLKFINSIEFAAANEAVIYSASTESVKNAALPDDCSQRNKKAAQPIYTKNSRLRKCCPHGEGLSVFRDNQTDEFCDSTNFQFEPLIISVVLYDNCIEDEENAVDLQVEIGNPCNSSLIYNDEDDAFFVLQDGSLLIMDKYGNDSYTVEKYYCLDMDNVSGITYAITCITAIEEHLKRGQIIAIAALMLVSIPCLLIVSYIHIKLKELRSVHGLCLSSLSLCLALGYFLHSLVHIFKIDSMKIGYAIQFLMLSYFIWFFCLCWNVLVNIWFRIPSNKRASKLTVWCVFGGHSLVCYSVAGSLVAFTIHKGLPGMPSYFMQGLTASIRESQRYFIPPVSSFLFLSFIVMMISFFGFQKIKKQKVETAAKDSTSGTVHPNIIVEIDEMKYEEVKKDAKCISFLGVILIVSWLLEIVTFYSPGPDAYLMVMEMINGLQGVFIMLIFVVVRRRRTVILRWWYDRGSHNVEDVELEAMNK